MAWTTPRDWVGGELVTEAIMDTHVRDNFLAVGPHLIARKTSDQSVTSSTTLVSDTALLFPVAANEVWRFDFDLLTDAGITGDLKFSFSFPTSGRLSAHSVHADNTNNIDDWVWDMTASDTPTRSLAGRAEFSFITISGVYVNAGTAGNVTLRFAQQTSDGTPSTVKTNSTLWAVKLA